MYDNAPRFKALIVFIEHRYYGKSIPFGGNEDVAKSNASVDDFEMGSLRNQRYFLGFVVLAAWFRLKYPHVAIGALLLLLQFLAL
ncbi:hypothetical protein GH714_030707 [Hevea brasiliensis]|uniref:Uncharacterized protein n=1 Tax=Hevea brasiliensis TaxID=3981 RepID=A0A6A6M1V8_HEVBR|nr:hypothetical protein GH714_030707 [Hevea brasiliensis]